MDNYTPVKKLYTGSYSTVYLVKPNNEEKLFVKKEIILTKMSTYEKEVVKKEVVKFSLLKHPNIIEYVEHFEADDKLHVVMEYAANGTLLEMVQRSSKSTKNRKGPGLSNLTEEEIMEYFCQICLAVSYLHEKQIIHRDIKIENLFFTSYDTVKLGDFGFSKIIGISPGMSATTIAPHYLSPEICNGDQYNDKVDVWIMGVLLYYLSMAKYPFEDKNYALIVNKILSGKYELLPGADNDNNNTDGIKYFSRDFLSLVDHCLDYNVDTRFDIKQVLSLPIVQAAMTTRMTKLKGLKEEKE